MKKTVLAAIGFLVPLSLGFLLEKIFVSLSLNTLILLLVDIAMVALWFLISRSAINEDCKPSEVMIWLNFPAFIMLAIIFLQEIVFKSAIPFIGKMAELYFVPFLDLGFIVSANKETVFPAYLVVFVLMFGLSFLGSLKSLKLDMFRKNKANKAYSSKFNPNKKKQRKNRKRK